MAFNLEALMSEFKANDALDAFKIVDGTDAPTVPHGSFILGLTPEAAAAVTTLRVFAEGSSQYILIPNGPNVFTRPGTGEVLKDVKGRPLRRKSASIAYTMQVLELWGTTSTGDKGYLGAIGTRGMLRPRSQSVDIDQADILAALVAHPTLMDAAPAYSAGIGWSATEVAEGVVLDNLGGTSSKWVNGKINPAVSPYSPQATIYTYAIPAIYSKGVDGGYIIITQAPLPPKKNSTEEVLAHTPYAILRLTSIKRYASMLAKATGQMYSDMSVMHKGATIPTAQEPCSLSTPRLLDIRVGRLTEGATVDDRALEAAGVQMHMQALSQDTTYKFATFTDDAANTLNFPDSTYTLTSTQFAALMADHLRKYPAVESIAYLTERAEYDNVLNTLPTQLANTFKTRFNDAVAKHRAAMLDNVPAADRKAVAALFEHGSMVQIASNNVHQVPAAIEQKTEPKAAPKAERPNAPIGDGGVQSYEAGKGSAKAAPEEEAPWVEEKAPPPPPKRAPKAAAKSAVSSEADADEKALIMGLTTAFGALKFDSGAAVTAIEKVTGELVKLADFYDTHPGSATQHQEWLSSSMISAAKFKKTNNARAATPGMLVLVFRDDVGAEVEATLSVVQPKGDKAETVELWRDALTAASMLLVGDVGTAEEGGHDFDVDLEALLA